MKFADHPGLQTLRMCGKYKSNAAYICLY
jgi:hypothetical protein